MLPQTNARFAAFATMFDSSRCFNSTFEIESPMILLSIEFGVSDLSGYRCSTYLLTHECWGLLLETLTCWRHKIFLPMTGLCAVVFMTLGF